MESQQFESLIGEQKDNVVALSDDKLQKYVERVFVRKVAPEIIEELVDFFTQYDHKTLISHLNTILPTIELGELATFDKQELADHVAYFLPAIATFKRYGASTADENPTSIDTIRPLYRNEVETFLALLSPTIKSELKQASLLDAHEKIRFEIRRLLEFGSPVLPKGTSIEYFTRRIVSLIHRTGIL
jgi:hypothetical protein